MDNRKVVVKDLKPVCNVCGGDMGWFNTKAERLRYINSYTHSFICEEHGCDNTMRISEEANFIDDTEYVTITMKKQDIVNIYWDAYNQVEEYCSDERHVVLLHDQIKDLLK